MRVLLDTNAFLWAVSDPERLGAQRPLIEDARSTLLLSAASSWEIAIKHELGRLELPEPPNRYVPERIRRLGIVPLPIDHADALAAGALPNVHRDPFDRLLVAQAQLLGVPIVTADATFQQYGVEVRAIG